MTTETDQLDYVEDVTGMMMRINQMTARAIALDLWRYYPTETQLLYASLAQTQHTKRVSKLEGG